MRQPEGFDDGSRRVFKHKRSLYGLKQAPRRWNKRFVDSMKNQRLIVQWTHVFLCAKVMARK